MLRHPFSEKSVAPESIEPPQIPVEKQSVPTYLQVIMQNRGIIFGTPAFFQLLKEQTQTTPSLPEE